RMRPRPCAFQSPLHRGMSSLASGMRQLNIEVTRFNPLFIGACHHSVCHFHELEPVKSFNPLFIGACHHSVDRVYWLVMTAQFQSPLHRGMSSLRSASSSSRSSRSFNPLFIGACHHSPHL